MLARNMARTGFPPTTAKTRSGQWPSDRAPDSRDATRMTGSRAPCLRREGRYPLGAAVGVLAASTAGRDLERLEGAGCPPALPPAELVLLRGDSSDEDTELFVGAARRQLLATKGQ